MRSLSLPAQSLSSAPSDACATGRTVLFYVSGHGFGHATRSRAVIDSLFDLNPETVVHVRTAAPSFLFRPSLSQSIQYWPVSIDPPVFESSDALSIDVSKTVASLSGYLDGLRELIASEVAFARSIQADVIAADIPFAAGLIAQANGLPSVAFGNFTWDWIFEAFPNTNHVVDAIRGAYNRFTLALRLRFRSRRVGMSFRKYAMFLWSRPGV